MSRLRSRGRLEFDAADFAPKRHRSAPHEFVLETLAPLAPSTRPMFGCLAVYVEEKIVLILRDRPTSPEDNGVWLATTAAHHASLRRDFPSMRSIRVLGHPITHWQVLPADAPDFEQAALRAAPSSSSTTRASARSPSAAPNPPHAARPSGAPRAPQPSVRADSVRAALPHPRSRPRAAAMV